MTMFKVYVDVYDTDETYLYHACTSEKEALSYFEAACRNVKDRSIIELLEVKDGFVTIIRTQAVK